MKPEEKKIIDVLLTELDKIDVLIFALDSEKYMINLNSSTSQNQIKEVFAKLLEILIVTDIELNYKVAEGYSKGLYKEVCKEYIIDLNREIQQVKTSIKQILK